MGGTPQRPADVPEGALWVDDAREWRHGPVDARGEKQGTHRSWRADGTLREEVHFLDGRGVGPYRRFHPNGDVAGQGEFVEGRMQGTLHAFACDAPTPEQLQPCCVPPNAWQLQTDYHRGDVMARRWYDRRGIQILESGAPHPPRPPSVPVDARYDEESARWVIGSYEVGAGRVSHWRRWTREGVLVEEEERAADVRHGVWRRFRDGDGALSFEAHYAQGLLDGSFLDRTIAAAGYRPAAVIEETGQFAHGQAVGVWRLRDRAGRVVAERELGVAVTEEGLLASAAFSDGDRDPGVDLDLDPGAPARLVALSQALRAERRVGEALVAMARAAALARDPSALRALLDQLAWPRAPAAAHDLAVAVIDAEGDRLRSLVDALVRGGEPAPLLRALAAALRGGYRAALQLVDAAALLAPDSPACRVTRALVNVHLGRPEDARADAEQLPGDWEEQRRNLLDYVRVIFPAFGFWPAGIAIETMFEEFPPAPAQPLPAIRAAVQRYATRLGAIRTALASRFAGGSPGGSGPGASRPAPDRSAAWLPPELSSLLPDGPVALGAWTFQQSFDPSFDEGNDAAAAGEEQNIEQISVEERLVLDGVPTPTLLGFARREWAALTWLCWSCGLDRVALPEVVAPPADFGRAAGMSIERAWRCRDKLASGGLVAMSKGVPGFEWEGMPIDGMSRAVAEVMTEEHVEVRAMFLWLCDATARSPWQSDLRDPD